MWISESLKRLEIEKNLSVQSLFKNHCGGKNKFSQMDGEEDEKNLCYEGDNLREITQSACLKDNFPHITWLIIGISPNVNLSYDVAEEGAIITTPISAQERQRKEWLQPKCYQSSDWTTAEI